MRTDWSALRTTGATLSTWRCTSMWSWRWPTSTGSRCRSPRSTPTVPSSATSSGQTRTATSRRQPIRGWAIQSTARRWTRSPRESTAEGRHQSRVRRVQSREREGGVAMLRYRILLCVLLLAIFPARALERPEITFKVFQFPANMIPRIDGNDDDWAMVPDSYAIGMDQLEDTEALAGTVTPRDPRKLD